MSSLPSPTTKPTTVRPGRLWNTRSRSSNLSETPIAEASIAKDLETEPDSDPENAIDDDHASDDESDSDLETLRRTTSESAYSMVGSYRRPSFTPAGGRATVTPQFADTNRTPSKRERREARRQERSLLRDNNVIPPKHPQKHEVVRGRGYLSVPGGDVKVRRPGEVAAPVGPDGEASTVTEATTLLGDPELPYGGQDDPETVDRKWEEAVRDGKIQTTWQRESKVLARYSAPLILTFLLQYSLTVASIFTVGHLGKTELAAVSLASMTANITGYAIYQGLATSLDTLCAQAYGSGRKKLVGLQTQRMIFFLWSITIPIAVIWLCADKVLVRIVPEKDVAELAGLYLKVVLIGAPGYATFESGKRYVQAQGLFSASLYVLLICAPLNAFMNWLFVWVCTTSPILHPSPFTPLSPPSSPRFDYPSPLTHPQQFKWGFIGAPIAVAITDNLLPLLLLLYTRLFTNLACWPGLTRRALTNWLPMIRLALPGLLMVLAEVLAFEILTLASSRFSTAHLAAQSVLSTLISFTFNIPFPISIAASTRIANLIGATLAPAAKTSAKVAFVASTAVGIINVILLSTLRGQIPQLFTADPDVIALVASCLPLCAAFQLFDALSACCNGVLRGLGRQEVGGYVQLVCYYVVGLPISFGLAFGAGWELVGLWAGVAIALGLVACVEGAWIGRADWERSVREARTRNEGG